MSRDIVFVYDHFYPDYSAGGPVTSLANLATLIGPSCNVKILTSAWYYDTGKKFEGIRFNEWIPYNDFTVWYADSPQNIDRAIKTLATGSTVYLNGIFSKNFFLRIFQQGVFDADPNGQQRVSKTQQLKLDPNGQQRVSNALPPIDLIVSPRGMLQHGALQNKFLKKFLYLSYLKISGRLKGVRWHATDEQERADIRKHFGKELNVEVIPNVPRQPAASNIVIEKTKGQLKLVCFSLISRKKNIRFLIDLLNKPGLRGITLDIIGPVKDADYWSECQDPIRQSKGNVNYLGDCDPTKVTEVLSRYHLFVLPTHGENFGHAIVEAMSSFRPVLISEHTPWKDIGPFNGGFSLPLITSQWESKLKEARDWSQDDFDKACVGAMDYFRKKISMSGLRSMYLSLFRIQS